MNRITHLIEQNQLDKIQERKNPNMYSIVDLQNQSDIIVQDLHQQNVDASIAYENQVEIKQIKSDKSEQNNEIKVKIETQTLYKVQEIPLINEQEQHESKNKNQVKQVLQKTQKKQSKYQDQQSTDKKKKLQVQPEVIPYKQPHYQVEPISISQKKQQKNNSPLLIEQEKPVQSLFSMNKQEYSNYIKAVFIQQQILDPIQKQNLLDYKQEKHLQFLFLITVRIRNYLRTSFKYFQQKQKTSKDFILKDALETMSAYIQKSQIKFQIYNERLDQIRGKLRNKISRIFHLEKSVNNKQKFLDGFQNLDYTLAQQVQFTHSNYIQIVLNSPEIKSEYFKNYRFKKILRGFRKICLVDPDSCSSELQFKNKINDIIIDQ